MNESNSSRSVKGTAAQERRLWETLELRDSDLRIGVDGGSAVWIARGLKPDICVGDWDSLKNPKKILDQSKHITLPTDKDRSDLFFAVIAAIEAGARQILCLGVTGGRPDHHMAMVSDLSIFSSGKYGALEHVEARGCEGSYIFLSGKIPCWASNLPVGQLVSFFTLSDVAKGVSLSGFEYSVHGVSLTPSSRGLSNRVAHCINRISLKIGRAMVVVPFSRIGRRRSESISCLGL